MTGASPNTELLERCVVLDAQGFVKTRGARRVSDLAGSRWRGAARFA
ncbi:MAG TPA: hypothetical protein VF516_26725 [Kofleriaceae bacterium]